MKINANISWIVPNIRILAVLPGVIPLSEREGIMDAEDTCLPWPVPLSHTTLCCTVDKSPLHCNVTKHCKTPHHNKCPRLVTANSGDPVQDEH